MHKYSLVGLNAKLVHNSIVDTFVFYELIIESTTQIGDGGNFYYLKQYFYALLVRLNKTLF